MPGIKKYICLHVFGLLFVSDFNHSRNVLAEVFNSVYVTKIRTLGTEFFHADGATDRQI